MWLHFLEIHPVSKYSAEKAIRMHSHTVSYTIHYSVRSIVTRFFVKNKLIVWELRKICYILYKRPSAFFDKTHET